MIGAMRPSSRFLTRKMLRSIPFEEKLCIVELGPGTGVFTREILNNMSEDSLLFVFELNDEFYKKLESNIDDPRVILIHDTAENMGAYLKAKGMEAADFVISSLPLANFSKKLRDNIVRTAKSFMKKNARFIQFQYTPQSMGYLNREFRNVRIDFTVLNFPPALVYICKK